MPACFVCLKPIEAGEKTINCINCKGVFHALDPCAGPLPRAISSTFRASFCCIGCANDKRSRADRRAQANPVTANSSMVKSPSVPAVLAKKTVAAKPITGHEPTLTEVFHLIKNFQISTKTDLVELKDGNKAALDSVKALGSRINELETDIASAKATATAAAVGVGDIVRANTLLDDRLAKLELSLNSIKAVTDSFPHLLQQGYRSRIVLLTRIER